MVKKFTKAQKKMLERKVQATRITTDQMNEFVGYLQEEHDAKGWQVLADLSGLEKKEKDEK